MKKDMNDAMRALLADPDCNTPDPETDADCDEIEKAVNEALKNADFKESHYFGLPPDLPRKRKLHWKSVLTIAAILIISVVVTASGLILAGQLDGIGITFRDGKLSIDFRENFSETFSGTKGDIKQELKNIGFEYLCLPQVFNDVFLLQSPTVESTDISTTIKTSIKYQDYNVHIAVDIYNEPDMLGSIESEANIGDIRVIDSSHGTKIYLIESNGYVQIKYAIDSSRYNIQIDCDLSTALEIAGTI